MMAHFLHRNPAELSMADNLRAKWRMRPKDFEVLEIWIEGPISASVKGFFQDAQTDVSVSELQNAKVVSTVESLARLIWNKTPMTNKTL